MKEFLPLFQTMLGGVLTLLGVYIVQRKSESREQKKLLREIIQECYENLLKMESSYLNESVLFYKGVRDNDLKRIKKSNFGDEGNQACNRAIALVDLYFPEFDDLALEIIEVEIEIMNFNSEIIDNFESVDKKKFQHESERLSDRIGDAIFDLKDALTERMQSHINF